MKNETDAKHQMDEYVEAQESGFHRMHRVMVPGCSGPCDQGRIKCPTPTACEVPQEVPFRISDLGWVLMGIGFLAGMFAYGPAFKGLWS